VAAVRLRFDTRQCTHAAEAVKGDDDAEAPKIMGCTVAAFKQIQKVGLGQ
jgi:hypothetical protein